MKSERGATMVSDQDIANALESLLREANPSTTLTSLNVVVQQLESKLGFDLSHKIDFIRNQIHLLFQSHPPPAPPPSQPPHLLVHHHQPPPNDQFVLNQNPNFHAASSQLPPNFAVRQHPGFRPPQRGPPQRPPAINIEAVVPDVATSAAASTVSHPAESPKERYN